MMPDLGKYTVEVLSAYAVSLGLIAVLVIVSIRQSSRTRALLHDVEAARLAAATAAAAGTDAGTDAANGASAEPKETAQNG
ncbi:heme exporter protein CcmD [Tropicimonas marinistellae]|uniref:heme exporter protein CcmD n=1 Tax=Tropicimonas marinistellae TaxID=1739787 RepID=UPI00098FE5FB